MPSLEPPPSQDVPVDAPQFRQWLYSLWAATATSAVSITSVISASLVSFIQAGIGAVTRTMQDKAREIVSVKDFGAVGDGVVNDSAAIQAAVTYALTQYGCGVFFPTGSYLCNSTVTILGGIFLKSDGAYIVNGQTNAPAIKFGDGVTIHYGGGVEGLWFTGKAGIVGVAGQKGLHVSKWGQITLRSLRSNLLGTALYEPFYFDNIAQSYMSDIEAQSGLSTGITFKKCIDARVFGCRSDSNTGHGFLLDENVGNIHVGCSAYNNAASGFKMNSTVPSTNPNKWNWFESCFADTNGSYNWSITDSRECHFIGCWGATQISITANTFATGFYIGTLNCNGLYFIGGMALYNNASGVYIDATASAPVNIRFTDFDFGTTVNGNGLSGTGYGLQLSSGNTGPIRVQGGQFLGNASGPYFNTSATTADMIINGNPTGFHNAGRVTGTHGTTTASANNLALPYDGRYFQISGITTINLISSTGWNDGEEIELKNNSALTYKALFAASGVNKTIVLNGTADFVAAAGSRLRLIWDATDSAWYEVARSIP